MRGIDVTHNTPRNFWCYVVAMTFGLALWANAILAFTDAGLLRFMAFGLLLIVAGLAYSPSTLDMTGWTLTVMAMFPLGLLMLIGSPIVYALWVAFIGPHVEVTIK